jgi:NAD(P)-dependent dehydrogenase (short-subunit alcohol dehydrogenase family)
MGVVMLLNGKTAIIFGAGGVIGGAVAKAFAREGARVFLSGRNAAPVQAVANDVIAVGGVAETATVDALDETAIERYVAEVAGKSGGVDVMLNAIGFRAVHWRRHFARRCSPAQPRRGGGVSGRATADGTESLTT